MLEFPRNTWQGLPVIARGFSVLVEISEIMDRGSLKAYLASQPKEVSQAVALRAALLVFPVVETSFSHPKADRRLTKELIFSSFRATHMKWIASSWPSYETLDAVTAAAKAVAANSLNVNNANATNANVAAAANYTNVAANVVVAVIAAYALANADIADDVWRDLQSFLSKPISAGGETEPTVLAQALWRGNIPSQVAERWLDQKHKLLTDDLNWAYWLNWYDARLYGESAKDEALYVQVAQIDEADWEQGAAHVNWMIAGFVKEHEAEMGVGGIPVVSVEALPTGKRSQLVSQVEFVLKTSVLSETTADYVATQLEFAISEYYQQEKVNQLPEGLQIVELMARSFRSLQSGVAAAHYDDGENSALQQKILELEAQVKDLTGKLAAAEYRDDFGKFWDAAVVSAGKWAGPAVLGGATVFLGRYVDPGILNGLAIELKSYRQVLSK